MSHENEPLIAPTPLEIIQLIAKAEETKWAYRIGPSEVHLIRSLAYDRDRLGHENTQLRRRIKELEEKLTKEGWTV